MVLWHQCEWCGGGISVSGVVSVSGGVSGVVGGTSVSGVLWHQCEWCGGGHQCQWCGAVAPV